MLEEAPATCPHCWETIVLAVDLSAEQQDYVEDCPVCCHPMRVRVTAADGEMLSLDVDRA